jgi:D-aminopeptidase
MALSNAGTAAPISWAEGLLRPHPEIIQQAGPDLWVVATRRSMDAPAPGDWTLQAIRGSEGHIVGLTLGCWPARGICCAECSGLRQLVET